jgi:hypothetical protein
VSALYGVTVLIGTIVEAMEHEYKILPVIQFIVAAPGIALNLVFFVWISFAFRRTLYHLDIKKQSFK